MTSPSRLPRPHTVADGDGDQQCTEKAAAEDEPTQVQEVEEETPILATTSQEMIT